MRHLDEIPSSHIRSRQMFVYMLHTGYKQLCNCNWNGLLSHNFKITTL
jgi:hypothetical protein